MDDAERGEKETAPPLGSSSTQEPIPYDILRKVPPENIPLDLLYKIYSDPQNRIGQKAETTRMVISMAVVLGFVITIGIIIVVTVVSLGQFLGPTDVLNLLKTVGSIYSGVTGVILGYYFARATES